MFEYDYTLEESGVEIEEKSNKQVSYPDLYLKNIITSANITKVMPKIYIFQTTSIPCTLILFIFSIIMRA